jgi:hypothetical protein
MMPCLLVTDTAAYEGWWTRACVYLFALHQSVLHGDFNCAHTDADVTLRRGEAGSHSPTSPVADPNV